MRKYCLMNTEFLFEKMKEFWKRIVVMVVHFKGSKMPLNYTLKSC